MPAQSPGVFLAIAGAVLAAITLLYVLVRLLQQCHLLSLKLCRPQYDGVCRAARLCCCCRGERAPKELVRADFERDDGTLVELSGSSDGGDDSSEDAQEGKEDKEARRYQEARARS